jgi:hypothetical protein
VWGGHPDGRPTTLHRVRKEPATTTDDARQFLGELISQLFHADVLITEQAERIDAPEGEMARL